MSMCGPDGSDPGCGAAVSDVRERGFERGAARGVEAVGVEEVKRGGLKGGLEDVWDVGEDLVEEEQGEEGADDAGFGVEAGPAAETVVG